MKFYDELNNGTGSSCLFDSCDDCDSKCDNCDDCDSRCDYEDHCTSEDYYPSCDTLTGGCSCDYDGGDGCYRD